MQVVHELGALIHLVVDGVRVVLAIVFRRRARLAAMLALIAFVVAVPVHIRTSGGSC